MLKKYAVSRRFVGALGSVVAVALSPIAITALSGIQGSDAKQANGVSPLAAQSSRVGGNIFSPTHHPSSNPDAIARKDSGSRTISPAEIGSGVSQFNSGNDARVAGVRGTASHGVSGSISRPNIPRVGTPEFGVAHAASPSSIPEDASFDSEPTAIGAEDSSPFQLAALGPVESIIMRDDGLVSVTVLGQEFLAADAQIGISEGDYVFAASFADSRLDLLVPTGEAYVTGVSDIQLVGEINSVDTSRAEFSIGDLAIDYSNLLADSPAFAPVPGDFVEISGNQASTKAPILLGIHGSGVRGIHGSGAR